jgi:glycosyltransferase involved in cell wall biosynthesis
MRILLLAQFFPPDIGGEERHVFNLATALAERGHEVAVATQRMADVPDRETLASGVRVHRFGTAAMRLPGLYSTSRTHHPPLPDPLGVRELARITRQERPHVVHAHNWIVNSAVALRRSSPAGPRFGLVLTLHDFSHVCATKRLMRLGSPCAGPAVARCLPCATAHYGPALGPLTAAATALMRPWKNRAIDHVVCVSSAVASGSHIPRGLNTSVIPNFVLDEAVLGGAGDAAEGQAEDVPPGLPKEKFLLFVGELSRDKGLPTLLRAYESLGRKRPPLLLIGRRTPDTPAHFPDGAEVCAEWPHDHVMAAFRRCLFAVLPSICLDACPTTVLEAMASGRPVVATTTGGIADMIADGENGLLVPPGDEHKLTDAMARLLNDADLRARLAAGTRERVQPFMASAVVERLEAVYAQVAPRNPGTSSKPAGRARADEALTGHDT